MAIMKLEVYHGEERLEIEVPDAEGPARIRCGGREVAADWVRLRPGEYSILVAGRVFDLTIDADGEAFVVSGRDGAALVRVADPRRAPSRHEVDAGRPGLERIVAEMPGKVIRILVRPGDPVACGQGLLVLEAMKMQNEIQAPKRGVVRELGVVEGKAVNSGDFLLSLE
jgi:biotin carboxyl carrier protein